MTYCNFDWFFSDTTGVYDDIRKLMNNPDPRVFMLALLTLDETRHQHDIKLLNASINDQEKKESTPLPAKKGDKRSRMRAFLSRDKQGKKPVSHVEYSNSEDLLALSQLRTDLADIQAQIKDIKREHQIPLPVQPQHATPVIRRRRRHHRRMFFFKHHL